MKSKTLFAMLLLFSMNNIQAQEQKPKANIAEETGVEIYENFMIEEFKEKEIKSDFKIMFANDEEVNYKKLKSYSLKRKSLAEMINPEINILNVRIQKINMKFQDTLSLSIEIEDLRNRIKNRRDNENISVDLYYTLSSPIIYEGRYPVKETRDEIIPRLEAAKNELPNQVITELKKESDKLANLKNNLRVIQNDITLCEDYIEENLGMDIKKQEFKKDVSRNFLFLIGGLLFFFFLIILFKSKGDIGKDLISGHGLQFATMFVLIIAIVLFGILGILEGRELAAILSGISGYVLGKGVPMPNLFEKKDKNEKEQSDAGDIKASMENEVKDEPKQ